MNHLMERHTGGRGQKTAVGTRHLLCSAVVLLKSSKVLTGEPCAKILQLPTETQNENFSQPAPRRMAANRHHPIQMQASASLDVQAFRIHVHPPSYLHREPHFPLELHSSNRTSLTLQSVRPRHRSFRVLTLCYPTTVRSHHQRQLLLQKQSLPRATRATFPQPLQRLRSAAGISAAPTPCVLTHMPLLPTLVPTEIPMHSC